MKIKTINLFLTGLISLFIIAGCNPKSPLSQENKKTKDSQMIFLENIRNIKKFTYEKMNLCKENESMSSEECTHVVKMMDMTDSFIKVACSYNSLFSKDDKEKLDKRINNINKISLIILESIDNSKQKSANEKELLMKRLEESFKEYNELVKEDMSAMISASMDLEFVEKIKICASSYEELTNPYNKNAEIIFNL